MTGRPHNPESWRYVLESDRKLRSDAIEAFAEMQMRRRRASGLAAIICIGVVVLALVVMSVLGI